MSITTKDIDECLKDDHNCSQHAVCYNVDGSYTCECVLGFEGNGVNCTSTFMIVALTPLLCAWGIPSLYTF